MEGDWFKVVQFKAILLFAIGIEEGKIEALSILPEFIDSSIAPRRFTSIKSYILCGKIEQETHLVLRCLFFSRGEQHPVILLR